MCQINAENVLWMTVWQSGEILMKTKFDLSLMWTSGYMKKTGRPFYATLAHSTTIHPNMKQDTRSIRWSFILSD